MHLPDSDSEDELPPGWEERVTTDGSVFYANHLTKQTQWTHPRTGKKKIVSGDLPFGWERCVDKNTGKVIYVDHENRRTTYTDPRLAFAIEEKEHVNDYRQRFDTSSTALQVLHGRDLNGKIAIITGANSGIGFETARSLAKHGCTTIFACRDVGAAEKSIEKIALEKAAASDKCEVLPLDLRSLKSVKDFADAVMAKYKVIDILLLNAGVFGLSYSKTEDGYETMFQVNHLSHFLLALLLKPLLRVGSRVIIVSSESHRSYLEIIQLLQATNFVMIACISPAYSGILAYIKRLIHGPEGVHVLIRNMMEHVNKNAEETNKMAGENKKEADENKKDILEKLVEENKKNAEENKKINKNTE